MAPGRNPEPPQPSQGAGCFSFIWFGRFINKERLAVVSPPGAPAPAHTRPSTFVHAISCQRVYLAWAASLRWLELLPMGQAPSPPVSSATLPSGWAEMRQIVMPVTALLIERATRAMVRGDIFLPGWTSAMRRSSLIFSPEVACTGGTLGTRSQRGGIAGSASRVAEPWIIGACRIWEMTRCTADFESAKPFWMA